jgi:large subunit ribosomal protein L23
MNEHYDIIKNVHLTEKSSILSEAGNQYVFRVLPTANKVQIRQAIEKLFKK